MKPGRAATFGKSAAQFLAGCVRQTVALKPYAEPDGGLLEAVKQWQQVFEHNPVMYFMVDPAGTVVNVNTFGAAQLGYTTAELIGQSVLGVFFEEDRDFVRQSVALCLETLDQSHTWEIRKVRKDGSVLWVRENAKAMLRADGKPIVLVACENITERKEAENALRQSEAYLAEAQQLSHTGSFGWKVATGELIWSKETFRIFQWDETTKPSISSMLQSIHPEDRLAVQQVAVRAARTGKDYDQEYRLLMRDGSVKYVRAMARATQDASGNVEFIGSVTDVTTAKEAERRYRESEQRFSGLCRDRVRLVLGDRTGPSRHPHLGTFRYDRHGPFRRRRAYTLGHCSRRRARAGKVATASGGTRRPSSVPRPGVPQQRPERTADLCPYQRQTIRRCQRRVPRVSRRLYGCDCRDPATKPKRRCARRKPSSPM